MDTSYGQASRALTAGNFAEAAELYERAVTGLEDKAYS